MKRAAAALLVLLVPSAVVAQQTVRSFAQLDRQGVVREGDIVWITFTMQSEGDETEVKCEVINLTDSAIVVQVRSVLSATTDLAISSDRRGSQIEIPESRVLKIVLAQRGDSLWNGFLIGGAVGTGTMALLLGGLAQRTNEYVQIAAIGFGFGAGIGLAADALKRGARETVYVAPGGSGETTAFALSLSPIVSKDLKGLLFTLNW